MGSWTSFNWNGFPSWAPQTCSRVVFKLPGRLANFDHGNYIYYIAKVRFQGRIASPVVFPVETANGRCRNIDTFASFEIRFIQNFAFTFCFRNIKLFGEKGTYICACFWCACDCSFIHKVRRRDCVEAKTTGINKSSYPDSGLSTGEAIKEVFYEIPPWNQCTFSKCVLDLYLLVCIYLVKKIPQISDLLGGMSPYAVELCGVASPLKSPTRRYSKRNLTFSRISF
jgi:hypothetical protein